MNILFLSYGRFEYDGRQRELIKICKQLGKTHYFTCTEPDFVPSEPEHICFRDTSRTAYFAFIRRAVRLFEELGNIDVVFADNRKATVPALRIKKKHPDVRIIQDARELYLRSEMTTFSGRMGCFFEERLYKKADIIVAANEYRAKRMQVEYHLAEKPLVYENLRRLAYSPQADMKKLSVRFGELLSGEEYKIISTSGCSVQRTNDKLVETLPRLQYPYKLFLVGDSAPQDREAIDKIVAENGISGVYILGRLGQDELKYLIDHSHIGIVNYGQYDTNNIYCASGKLYEFLYEGKPVVTTTNPPLADICAQLGVGEASDDYAQALNRVMDDYEGYCSRVQQAVKNMSIEENNDLLVTALRQRLALKEETK
jgi:glycosyltransferase involved in cell wall biosynthesis